MDGNESLRFGPINWAPFPLMAEKMLSLSLTALSYLSSLATHPLFSAILTLYALVLLYLPRIFLRLLLSPVPVITAALLLSLLRLGAVQKKIEGRSSGSSSAAKADVSELDGFEDAPIDDSCSEETDSRSEINSFGGCPCFEHSFVEWDVKAPLEVIYEGYEGEEEDGGDKYDEYHRHGRDAISAGGAWGGIERYASLSMCYPDSDSDSETSSDGDFPVIGDYFDSPERDGFRWEEWEEREGLIEIALDLIDEVVEEENLIEIDISTAAAARNGQCV